jgi:tRNA pseudouridine13 synthase
MILKQHPADFQVEELTDIQPGDGPFSLYRLEKSGWTTPDAMQVIGRRWHLDRRRLSYGGLKDRHAQTVQYFSVFRGPQRRLTHQNLMVTYLGQVAQPFLPEHIRANHFQLILRDVSREERAIFSRAFEEVRQFGVPNYFDDQRFGSVTAGNQKSEVGGRRSEVRGQKSRVRGQESAAEIQESEPPLESPVNAPVFLAKSIILGRYEEALKLALTACYPYDRGPQKKEKALLRAHWGDWARCRDLLPRGHTRLLVDYLACRPDDFSGALARLRPELRGLYLSAYQSFLWNRMLAAWLSAHFRSDQLVSVPLKLGAVPMHRALGEADLSSLRRLHLPLPSHHVLFENDDPRQPFFDQVLREENLTLDQFKLKGCRNTFFSHGERPALCLAANLEFIPNPDDTHPGKQKLRLSFDLPRGSYATLLVKRLITPAS